MDVAAPCLRVGVEVRLEVHPPAGSDLLAQIVTPPDGRFSLELRGPRARLQLFREELDDDKLRFVYCPPADMPASRIGSTLPSSPATVTA